MNPSNDLRLPARHAAKSIGTVPGGKRQTEQTAVRRYMVLRFALWPERRAEHCASINLYETALNINIDQIALGFMRK